MSMPRRSFLQLAGRAGAGLGVATPLLEASTNASPQGRLRNQPLAALDPSRIAFTIDNGWSIATDPGNIGRQEAWFRKPRLEAKTIRVPSILQEAFPSYHGVVWYWVEVEAPQNPYPHGRYFLRFHAVDYLADVWLNSVHIGSHEGGETPFVLDATAAMQPGKENLLAVRVLNPGDQPIDGIVLAETPHHNKFVHFQNGAIYDYGGIIEPVELFLTPPFRIQDLFLRPDWQSGSLQVRIAIDSSSEAIQKARLSFTVSQSGIGDPVTVESSEIHLPASTFDLDRELKISKHHLWELDDPFLYRLSVVLESTDGVISHQASVRFGFRDFRVVNGYFRLNGRRLFLRSTHTGNHVPFGLQVPPPGFPDLARRDMIYAKACGFNTVRFIAGVGFPYQMDMCDELGLLVYEESAASWLLQDSPKMKERYEGSVREMILRDRNHPSLVIWGLLNETKDGPVFREARSALPLVRSLDDTRLVLLSSGRFDGHLEVGSVSNPGSSQFEYLWGAEAPGAPQVAMKYPSGLGAGDFHLYPTVPQTPETNRMIRDLGKTSNPVFLSEYGIGSMMDVIHETRMYEQAGIPPDAEDYLLMKSMADRLVADWSRFGMETVYPTAETLLRESQKRMAHHRLVGFNLIRSNPQICGFNLTGMLDHAYTGEGVWRFWRDWKPGAFDAMCDGWAPLRWCLFAEPSHTYLENPVTLEAVLANEDVLKTGEYPVQFRVWGPKGNAWSKEASISIPPMNAGHEPPLAIPVLKEEVTFSGPAGRYKLAPFMPRGAAPPETSWHFYLSDRKSLPMLQAKVVTWGVADSVESWLAKFGVQVRTLNSSASLQARELILVGDVSKGPAAASTWRSLVSRIATGSTVVFLSPQAFKHDTESSAWLPLAKKGRVYEFHDWLYHKECVAKPHPIFEGLQGDGVLDWDYYGPVLPRYLFDGQNTPDMVIVAAFAAGYSTPGGYASGVLLGSYRIGAGTFFVNSFDILENLDKHPAADRLLLNLLQYANEGLDQPPAPLMPEFDRLLKEIGYGE
jgi:Glycosyl hydrolases family 2, sugar binding domain/Glycosyl hydrolases family 2/Glycosyl hydrolases family 2, TIM barrel domain